MKKLIWMTVLGVVFFIGGQWLGLWYEEVNTPAPVVIPASQDASAEGQPAAPQSAAPQPVAPTSLQETGSGGTNP